MVKRGDKVKCIYMDDPYNPVPSGTIGIVTSVDDMGQIHVRWETGSGLPLNPEVDKFEIIGGDNMKFDINKYTALVVLASQTKNPITICEEDLYDFAEMDMDFKTGIINATTPDVDIGDLYPHEYADIYTKWITEAVIRYNKMRDEFLAGEQ